MSDVDDDREERVPQSRMDRLWEIVIETRQMVRDHIAYCQDREKRQDKFQEESKDDRHAIRLLIQKFSWGIISILLVIVGYIIVNGVPWHKITVGG